MDNTHIDTQVRSSATSWRKTDTMWMLGLYGTAIGAGVLFLPINAGIGGLIPLLIMTVLAFPMTFFAHRGLTRFVLSGKNAGEDITEVVEEHFGISAGKLITLLYFFAIYPILLVYSVAITNTVESFITHQMHMTAPPRHSFSGAVVRLNDAGAFRSGSDRQSHEYFGLPVRCRINGAGAVSDPKLEHDGLRKCLPVR